MDMFTASYCNKPHRTSDGVPVNHECYVLSPKALRLEREGHYSEAQAILSRAPRPRIHKGVKLSEAD